MCTRGGLLKKTAAVYMFSLYPLKLSEGKKRKILKVREELRLGTCQSTFFFAFGAAAVANCYRATLCLAEQKNILMHFVQKYLDITAHSFHFWHFFTVEDLRGKKRKFYLLLMSLPSPNATETSLYFVQKYVEIFPFF